MNQTKEKGLIRGIRKWDLIALIINGIIGAGIFGLPSKIFALTNSYSLLAFIVCAIVVSFIILCFAEVSSYFSETGGPYLYARETFGSTVGFEIGWLTWLTRVTAFAAICNLLITYLSYFFPAASSQLWRTIIIITIVCSLTTINFIGIRETAIFNNIFTIGKLIPLLIFIIIGMFFIDFQNYSFSSPPDFSSFSTAVMLLIYAFSGFEASTINAGEVKDPRHNIPLALIIALAVVAVFYILIQFVSIGTLPGLASADRPLTEASTRFLGNAGASIISIGAIISMMGTLNSAMLAGTRLPFALAEQGQLPTIFSATHKSFHTPYISILFSSAIILIFTLTYTFMSALTITTITRLIVYAVTCGGLLALRRNNKGRAAAFKIPAGIFVSTAALLLCVWLLSSSALSEVQDVGIVIGVGLLLHIIYSLIKRKFVHRI